MIAMKFGGTSLGTPASVRQACRLVADEASRRPVVVVASAHNSPSLRMTDALVASARAARDGRPNSNPVASAQLGICRELGVDAAACGIGALLEKFDRLLGGLAMIGELTPRTMDMVMSFGERMSARVVNDVLSREFGVKSLYRSSMDLGLRTDANFGAARPDPACYPEVARRIADLSCGALVTTGFIAADAEGRTTTLGRGGSDYSATIFGAIVGAEEVQIWTDVSGVMTADPRIAPAARSIPELTFMEAAELAWYGAKVLHPATMLPAIDNDIPVLVKNTADPGHPGTVIRGRVSPAGEAGVVKSLAVMRGVAMLTITTGRMFGMHGFMSRVFDVFNRHAVDVHMIATSEVTISVTTPDSDGLERAAGDIRAFAEVKAERGLSLVSVVGERMKGTPGVAARVTRALAESRANIRMISQGASEINISLVVEEAEATRAVLGLHREFFESAGADAPRL